MSDSMVYRQFLEETYGLVTVITDHGAQVTTIDEDGFTHGFAKLALTPCTPRHMRKPRDIVQHEVFGRGQVTAVAGGRCLVEFAGSKKWLLMNMVELYQPPKAAKPSETVLKVTKFDPRDPSEIPRREWLYGGHYVRCYPTATVGAGGGGKSSNAIPEALSMVTGRPLLGGAPHQKLRVWYMNLEDPADEIERRFVAAMLHYGLEPEDLGARLFTDSGRDQEVVIAKQLGREIVVQEPMVEALVRAIKTNEIDVLIVDPFISSHQVPENDNTAIQVVAGQWARVANDAECSVELIHHVRKGDGEITADDARGGGALKDKTRSMRVINKMTAEEASKAGIVSADRDLYFRIDSGKANMTRKSSSTWRKFESVTLPNGEGNLGLGDSVGVVASWCWPSNESLLAEVSTEQIELIKQRTAVGSYRESSQAKEWAGYLVAEVLNLPSSEKDDKAYLSRVIGAFISAGHLKVVQREDASRRSRPFIEPVFADAPPIAA
jgi:hypothetical protein